MKIVKDLGVLFSAVLFFVIFPGISSAQDNYEHVYYYSECGCSCEHCRNCEHGNNQHGEYGYRRTISEKDFSELKNIISKRSFESSKSGIAKSAADKNYFLSRQLKEMLQLFTFESTKIELAKYCYSKVVDKNNFYQVYDVFTFESSISSVEDFIREAN